MDLNALQQIFSRLPPAVQAACTGAAGEVLARNALLLTMIARVHFHLGALPKSRLELYQKCEEKLLEHWVVAAGLPPSPIDRVQKATFLRQLA